MGHTSTKVKFSKLAPRKWDSFELSIHYNRELSDVDKFNYLYTLQEGPALEKGMLHDGERYQASLPWKESHPPLPDNYDLALRRLDGLLKRLRQNPELLHQYKAVIHARPSQQGYSGSSSRAKGKGPQLDTLLNAPRSA